MALKSKKWKASILGWALSVALLGGVGYAVAAGTPQIKAANVTQYLREKGNIPMRRIMAPAGYGATHPAATNSDPQGRELNRRVEVKVLLNKGLVEGM